MFPWTLSYTCLEDRLSTKEAGEKLHRSQAPIASRSELQREREGEGGREGQGRREGFWFYSISKEVGEKKGLRGAAKKQILLRSLSRDFQNVPQCFQIIKIQSSFQAIVCIHALPF